MSRHYCGEGHESSRHTGLLILVSLLFIHGCGGGAVWLSNQWKRSPPRYSSLQDSRLDGHQNRLFPLGPAAGQNLLWEGQPARTHYDEATRPLYDEATRLLYDEATRLLYDEATRPL
ncbi:hypothetical protein NHX12_034391 [Muraenolepis orangiensis]|uniref:Transmembrane protein n=1 Tax=Muraenolepis orangiensis TaxID=630683 RepID=A0A9Q0I4C3_9TELE|nr:hypothetical protein NHX12_034391 [Muraenolepis orangiensis]